MSDMVFQSAGVLAQALQKRELSCEEALDLHLDRVRRLDGKLNAVPAIDEESARKRAREADTALAAGESWGPLHGVPMTIKDSFEVTGMPTTSGAPKLKNHVSKTNADAVQRLMDAGAVVFGKTNLPLFAGDYQSYNEVYGTTNNPWDLSRSPGGSSGGSAAALAAGMTPLELGSDIGGSIRNPAHYCGVYGHKSSYGIVPMNGHIPGPPGCLTHGDLAVAGPLARDADDLELAMDILSGPRARESRAWSFQLPPARVERLKNFRVAVWLDDPLQPVETAIVDVLQGVVDQLGKAGARVDDRARPIQKPAAARALYLQLLYANMANGFPEPVLEYYDDLAEDIEEDDRSLTAQMARGISLRFRNYMSRNEKRARLRTEWDRFFQDFDVLICPVMPTTAMKHNHAKMEERRITVNGKEMLYQDQIFWAGLATLAHLPATSVPCGVDPSGLPVGLQAVGPFLEDRTTIQFARALTPLTGGFQKPPGY
ncbi:MAG: amidase [Acidobacteriota bacterium]|nr:amidase [Acidobacteriota bacterium]